MSNNNFQQHIILLLQFEPGNVTSRQWFEFPTTSLACENLISLYEKRLKEINPGLRNIQYNVQDFNNYLDHLPDACALLFNQKTLSYTPHDKEWLKSKVLQTFQKMAASSSITN